MMENPMDGYRRGLQIQAVEEQISPDVNHCMRCNRKLMADDKAIYMKMVSRNAMQFLCMDCLAVKLGCTREALEERVRYYRESGNCVLFR